MPIVKGVLEAQAAGHRQLPVLGKAMQRLHRRDRPATAPGDHDGPLRLHQQHAQVAQSARRRPGQRGFDARQHRRGGRCRQHVLGKRQHHRTRSPLHRGVEGSRHVLGQAVRALHLGCPLGHAQRAWAEHLPVIHLLEGLAVALIARHLTHEHDHRRGVLECRVHADGCVRRPGPARDEADAGSAAELALRIGHEACAALLPAGDEADAVAVLVQAVEHSEITLSRDTETSIDALGDQRLHQRMAGQAGDGIRVTHDVAPLPGIPDAVRRPTHAAAVIPRMKAAADPAKTPAAQPRSIIHPNRGAPSVKPTSKPA